MTGLNVEFAEPLQLCNYGIGGHYVPHHDFSLVRNYNNIRYYIKREKETPATYFDFQYHVKSPCINAGAFQLILFIYY